MPIKKGDDRLMEIALEKEQQLYNSAFADYQFHVTHKLLTDNLSQLKAKYFICWSKQLEIMQLKLKLLEIACRKDESKSDEEYCDKIQEQIDAYQPKKLYQQFKQLKADIIRVMQDNWIGLAIFFARFYDRPKRSHDITYLPNDMLLIILSFLAPREIFQQSMGCAQFILDHIQPLNTALTEGQSFRIIQNQEGFRWQFFRQPSLKRDYITIHSQQQADDETEAKRLKRG